jgi:hypothetical protein
MRTAVTTTFLAASLAFAPGAVLAQSKDISYSYVDLAYVETDIDGIDKDLDGFALRGSLDVGSNVFLFAGYTDQSADFFGIDVDFQQYDVGVGYAWSFADDMDLYGKLGYVAAEADGGGVEIDDDGYELGVGLRARPLDPLELEGAITYVDLSDSGDDTSFGVAARWFFVDQFALGIEAAFGDDAESYGIGFRWSFGQ